MEHPFTTQAIAYCEDILSDKLPACIQIKQACERHLADLDKIDSEPNYPYTYSIEKAEKVCRFVSSLVHVSGRWAALKDNHVTLQPWQSFFLTCIFGWVHKETGLRKYREILISVSRKNGKSFLDSAVGIYMLVADQEPGAQVYCSANTMEQALTVFRPAKLMIERLPALRDAFGIEVNAKSLVTADGSRMSPVVGTARDGQSASLAIIDEWHEADTTELFDSMSQSMGARTQPLLLISSTSGYTIEGPLHQYQHECEQMLSGVIDRPELFALIYTLDKTDDWTKDEALFKANPNLGISVNLDALRVEHKNAIRTKAKQNIFKTKKLNIWAASSSSWMNMQRWNECADEKLTPDSFAGMPCVMAADFSTKLDVTCVLKLFAVGDKVYCFPRFYLPGDVADDPTKTSYAKWVSEGFLISLEGSQIDMEQVLEDTVADIEKYKPAEFAFDAWRSEMFTEYLTKRCPGLTLAQIPMQTRHLSPAMNDLEALVVSKKLFHDNNPVMNFMMSNVSAKEDVKGNIFPRKAMGRPESKIDGALALIMAVARSSYAKNKETFLPFCM